VDYYVAATLDEVAGYYAAATSYAAADWYVVDYKRSNAAEPVKLHAAD
jgi:hypothetical protein